MLTGRGCTDAGRLKIVLVWVWCVRGDTEGGPSGGFYYAIAGGSGSVGKPMGDR